MLVKRNWGRSGILNWACTRIDISPPQLPVADKLLTTGPSLETIALGNARLHPNLDLSAYAGKSILGLKTTLEYYSVHINTSETYHSPKKQEIFLVMLDAVCNLVEAKVGRAFQEDSLEIL